MIKILLVSIKWHFYTWIDSILWKNWQFNHSTFRFQGVNYHYITSLSGHGSPIYPYPLAYNMHSSSGWEEDDRNIFKTNAPSTFQFYKILSTHNATQYAFQFKQVYYPISNETQLYISRVPLFGLPGNSMKFFSGFKDLSPLLCLIFQL